MHDILALFAVVATTSIVSRFLTRTLRLSAASTHTVRAITDMEAHKLSPSMPGAMRAALSETKQATEVLEPS